MTDSNDTGASDPTAEKVETIESTNSAPEKTNTSSSADSSAKDESTPKTEVAEKPPVEVYTAPMTPSVDVKSEPTPPPAPTPVVAAAPVTPVVIPAPEPPVALPTPLPASTTAPAVNPATAAAVGVINELLNNYKTILSVSTGTASSFQNAARLLGNVVTRMLTVPTEDSMLAVWNFFVANKTGVMQESVALKGVDVLDTNTRFKVEMVYTLFRMAGNGTNVGDSNKINLQMVQNRLKCPALILFLEQQAHVVNSAAAARV